MTDPARDQDEQQEHRLHIGRRRLGSRTYGTGGSLYGTTGRCSCGWEGRDNTAPSAGGRRGVREQHDHETGAKATIDD